MERVSAQRGIPYYPRQRVSRGEEMGEALQYLGAIHVLVCSSTAVCRGAVSSGRGCRQAASPFGGSCLCVCVCVYSFTHTRLSLVPELSSMGARVGGVVGGMWRSPLVLSLLSEHAIVGVERAVPSCAVLCDGPVPCAYEYV